MQGYKYYQLLRDELIAQGLERGNIITLEQYNLQPNHLKSSKEDYLCKNKII